jgi:hypothetical protein
MSAQASSRTYRFAPLDRTGWLLGLSGAQCLSIAAGVVVAGVLLDRGAPAPLVLSPFIAGIAFAFATLGSWPAHEMAPAVARFATAVVRRRRSWTAEVPLLTGTPADAERAPTLPPIFQGLALLDGGPATWCPQRADGGVGVVLDRRARTVSASLPVRGRDFSLLERGDQQRLVGLWGDALAAFCSERSPVAGVRVTEWAAPSGLAEHERHLAAAGSRSAGSEPHSSYAALLSDAGPGAMSRELLLTVTVEGRRLSQRGGTPKPATDQAVEVLFEHLRLLGARLESAGLTVEPPLSPVATAELLRVRCDPTVAQRLDIRRRSLAALARAVVRYDLGPLATETGWSFFRTDGSLHRTYWVAEWPRLDVGPNWLEPLLLYAGGVRSFAFHYEPVSPSRSRRRIDRDATRLAADEEQRARGGFRIGARHRRAQEAVLEREAELVSGYAELEFAGFVTVTGRDQESLERSCAEYEQSAAQAGLELRALDGRQDVAFLCTLPLGRGLAGGRWR